MNNIAEIVRVIFLKKNIFAFCLILERIFSKEIFYYLGVGCLFFESVSMVVVSNKLVKRVNSMKMRNKISSFLFK